MSEREKAWTGTERYEVGTEIDINRDAEPRYRAWLRERTTRTTKPLYYQEAVYGGAEAIGISPITTRRYLSKATSPQGDFLLITHKSEGQAKREIVWKHSWLTQKKLE